MVFFSCRSSQRQEKRDNPLSDLGASSVSGRWYSFIKACFTADAESAERSFFLAFR
jgi:hypothetical protein